MTFLDTRPRSYSAISRRRRALARRADSFPTPSKLPRGLYHSRSSQCNRFKTCSLDGTISRKTTAAILKLFSSRDASYPLLAASLRLCWKTTIAFAAFSIELQSLFSLCLTCFVHFKKQAFHWVVFFSYGAIIANSDETSVAPSF